MLERWLNRKKLSLLLWKVTPEKNCSILQKICQSFFRVKFPCGDAKKVTNVSKLSQPLQTSEIPVTSHDLEDL
jgi:hypothetical protein